MMRRRTFVAGLGLGALSPLSARLCAAGRVARIGVLFYRPQTARDVRTQAFIDGLRELGYVEGRNIQLERRSADGHAERLPALAAELVRSDVDVIVISGPQPLAAARSATQTIPLVMVASTSDPVREGIAVSLNRPGGNITGLTYAEPDRFKKQLELLKTAAGKVTRVAVLWDFDPVIFDRAWGPPLAEAARVLGMEAPRPVPVTEPERLAAAFAQIAAQRADAMLVASGGFIFSARARVAELAIEHRLPAIAAFKEFPQAGLLMSFGPDLTDIYRRAAGYVERILKGAKPGDLPIEMPTKHELVLNLRTAKALGLDLSQPLLLRADEVIR